MNAARVLVVPLIVIAFAGAASCRAPGGGSAAGADPSASSGAPPPPLDTSWQRNPGRPLAEGDVAPNFEGIAHTGMRTRLSAFLDGEVVVYFYGRDGTQDSTALADGLRDAWLNLHEHASMVIGVSPDDRVTHRDFATKEELPFLLVADENHAIARAFGVPVDDGKEHRFTFVIGKDGKIRKVFAEPSPEGHAAEVIAALGTAAN